MEQKSINNNNNNSVAALKKRLLATTNKRKMSLRRQDIKVSECRLEIRKITKCVFLGSLCLKPMPHLFDSLVLFKQLDMNIEGLPSSDIQVDVIETPEEVYREGEATPTDSESPAQPTYTKRRLLKKKCLMKPKKSAACIVIDDEKVDTDVEVVKDVTEKRVEVVKKTVSHMVFNPASKKHIQNQKKIAEEMETVKEATPECSKAAEIDLTEPENPQEPEKIVEIVEISTECPKINTDCPKEVQEPVETAENITVIEEKQPLEVPQDTPELSESLEKEPDLKEPPVKTRKARKSELEELKLDPPPVKVPKTAKTTPDKDDSNEEDRLRQELLTRAKELIGVGVERPSKNKRHRKNADKDIEIKEESSADSEPPIKAKKLSKRDNPGETIEESPCVKPKKTSRQEVEGVDVEIPGKNKKASNELKTDDEGECTSKAKRCLRKSDKDEDKTEVKTPPIKVRKTRKNVQVDNEPTKQLKKPEISETDLLDQDKSKSPERSTDNAETQAQDEQTCEGTNEKVTKELPVPTPVSDEANPPECSTEVPLEPSENVAKLPESTAKELPEQPKEITTLKNVPLEPPKPTSTDRTKKEMTPELLLSDSDDETIDQLMYNIMDIKIEHNLYDKNFFDMPPSDVEDEDVYQSYSSTFNGVIPALQIDDKDEKEDKKCVKRTPQCKICSQVFSSYMKLKKHKLQHNGDTPYLCLKCGDNHTTLEQLIAHLRKHEGKRPYVCKKCNGGFKTMEALEKHRPVHILRKPTAPKKTFRCDVCAKEFRKLCDLERHTRVHTGEKPSVCNICNRRFQQAHNLNKHLLIHTQEKPYQCDICNKKFGRNDVLNRHLLTHSVKKPNHCDVCLKSFIRVSQLMAHKEKYHNGSAEKLEDKQA